MMAVRKSIRLDGWRHARVPFGKVEICIAVFCTSHTAAVLGSQSQIRSDIDRRPNVPWCLAIENGSAERCRLKSLNLVAEHLTPNPRLAAAHNWLCERRLAENKSVDQGTRCDVMQPRSPKALCLFEYLQLEIRRKPDGLWEILSCQRLFGT